MNYVLEPLRFIENSSNSLTGSFVNIMKYKGVECDECEVQLLYAGIRLNLVYREEIMLCPNFLPGIHNFCSKNNIDYRRVELPAVQLKEIIFDILKKNGPCILALNSDSLGYYKSAFGKGHWHYVAVTGVDDEGIYIIDSCSSAVQGSVWRGKIPFSDILEIRKQRRMRLGFVAGEIKGDFPMSGMNIRIERQKFINENIELELGSRLKTSLDYCEYLASGIEGMALENLRSVANNIMGETHVPQLKMIQKLFVRDSRQYTQIDRLCNDWMLLSYRLIKESLGGSVVGTEVLIDNYKSLIHREREIYR